MSRDFTVFQFDVDEDAVRRILSLVPGVTPLPPDEETAPDESRASSGNDTGGAGDAGAERSIDDELGGTTETSAERPGAEAHLSGSVGPGAGRSGAEKWTGPSTPWPGAPGDEDEEEGGLLDRLRDKRTLLIGGAVALLGVVSAVAVWYLKFRGDSGSGQSGGRPSRFRERTGESTDADADPTEREPHADDAESRSYPVDAAPVVGMAFLAIGSVVLRHYQSRSEP